MNPIENIPDFVVYALSTPELRSSEELQQWLAESQANKDLFDDLLAYREAERRLLPENTPSHACLPQQNTTLHKLNFQRNIKFLLQKMETQHPKICGI